MLVRRLCQPLRQVHEHMTVVVLLRHGATDFNAEGRLQGRLDVPLGERGIVQAQAAAAALAADYGAADAVLSSPLARAVGTAQRVGEALGARPQAVDALTQRAYGEWEGLTWDEVRERWPDEYSSRMNGLDPAIKGWEASAVVGARVASALETACEGKGLVVAVSHGSAIQLGAMTLLGLDAYSHVLGKLEHGRWHVLRRREPGQWTLERVGLGPADFMNGQVVG